MKKRKRPRPQVTCLCGAYDFPHRLGAGRCTGSAWAQSYFEYDREECGNCNLNAGTYCEAGVGQEKITYCEGMRDHLRAQPDIRHPLYGERLERFLYPSHDHYCDEDAGGPIVSAETHFEEIPF